MQIKLKILSAALAVLTLTFSALWLREQKLASSLSARVGTLMSDNVELASSREGLRQANEDLRAQLDQLRNAPPPQYAQVEDLPPLTVQLPPAMPDPEEEEVAVVSMERPERPARTPEEEEQAQARREAWEARRQEWEQRREEFRDRVVGEAQERRAFFAQVSMEGLAPEYRESHERLLGAMEEVEVLVSSLNNPELDREQQRELRRELGGIARELQGLMSTQREILLNDFAQALGYNGEDARSFIDYIETVNQMTNMGGFLRGGGGPPRGQARPERE